MFIDTHAHLNFKAFKDDYKDAIKQAFDAEVKGIINVGSNFETSGKAIKIANQFENEMIFAAVGLHPIHVDDEDFHYEKYLRLAKNKKVVAIGETGLDFFRIKKSNFCVQNDKKQIEVFKEHIKLAKELNLPLIAHCRGSENNPHEAYDKIIEIIRFAQNNMKDKIRGVIHCFVGNLAQAKALIGMGFYIGVNGIATFKNSCELQNIIKVVALEKIILETDCPWLAPIPYRGKQNSPQYIPVIAQKIAEIKNINIKKVAQTTTKNVRKLFTI